MIGNQSLWASVLVIGLAASVAGAGTFAQFSDTETSASNTIQAGTLDLTPDGPAAILDSSVASNMAPGSLAASSLDVTNDGSIDGDLDLKVKNVANNEGNNPESETDTSSPGDLGDEVFVAVSVDGTVALNDTANNLDGSFANDVATLAANGGTSTVELQAYLPSTAGNDVQGDEVTFDLELQLGQSGVDY